MKHFVNKDRIVEGWILEPYENCGEPWDSNSHGWQLVLVIGYLSDGCPNKIIIDKESEVECHKLASSLNLMLIKS